MSTKGYLRLETIEEIFGGELPVQGKRKIFVKIPEDFEMIEELKDIKRKEAIRKHSELLRKLAERDNKKREYAKRLLAKF